MSASLCRSAWYAPAELGELEPTDAEAEGEGVPEAVPEAEAEPEGECVAEAETGEDAEAEAECVADPVLSGPPVEVPFVASWVAGAAGDDTIS
jgi:hypothetical protein